MRPILRAVVPAAGRGTRLHPHTADTPKELLPVGGVPMIRHCLEEALASGIVQIAVVLAPGKEAIRTYLEEVRDRGAGGPFAERLRRCRLEFPVQPTPRGVADALRCARSFTAGEPFAVLLPDNIAFATPPPLAQMVPHLAEDAYGLALTVYRPETAAWFGNCGRVDCAPGPGPVRRILRLHDKGQGTFRVIGPDPERVGYARYVLQPDFFDRIPDRPPRPGGEIDDTPILQEIARGGRLFGVEVTGDLFDAGHPAGFEAANRFATAANRRGASVAFDPGSR